MKRRDILRAAALLPLAAACTPQIRDDSTNLSERPAEVPLGWKPPGGELNLDKVKIKKVRAITTAPYGTKLVIVKVETDQPGLYGVGCATFTQRILPVVSAVNDYLDDFCRDKDASNIEDIWQTAYVSSYWRNGPVLNNALSGLDQALWDIKGKMAGMPVYQLLGGKCRFAVDCYSHANGKSPEELVDSVQRIKEKGFRHIRIQLGGYGATHMADRADFKDAGFGTPDDNYMN